MKPTKDLLNNTFGRLTVITKGIPDKYGKTCWFCKCSCGSIKSITAQSLIKKLTTSCGCFHKEQVSKIKKTHGVSRTTLYKVFKNMEDRCYKKDDPNFKYYGNRGIIIEDEWKNNVLNFVKWSKENGYKKGLQIDRINNDGNYSPENCRWTTGKENSNNKRNNHKLDYNGEILTLRQFSIRYDINYSTLQRRVSKNWSFEKLIKKVNHEH